MNILYNEEHKYFHLYNDNISYILGIEKDKYISHLYFGERISEYNRVNDILEIDRGFSINDEFNQRKFSQSTLPMEYSTVGYGDFREPAFLFEHFDGTHTVNFCYAGYEISIDKPKSSSLPYTRGAVNTKTLEITLFDKVSELEIKLRYTIYENIDIICRSTKFINNSKVDINLLKANSFMLDMQNDDYELITLSGAHTNEGNINRRVIKSGIQGFFNKRYASGPFNNPFLGIVKHETNEFHGDAYGFALIYSGGVSGIVEEDPYGMLRVSLGIDVVNFKWCLEQGGYFETPEVVMTFSNVGLNKMSQNFHKLIKEDIISSKFKRKRRPILINNWEATYMDFTERDLFRIIDASYDLGIELFVLDDGWFGKRNNDSTSLGDWEVNQDKLPNGLKAIINRCKKSKMKFGLWFEPEMVSVDSKLYEQHPEWVLKTPKYDHVFGRNQLVLDLTQKEVCNYIYSVIEYYIKEYDIEYIKWDMNRNITDIFSNYIEYEKQGEVGHRYILGLYSVLNKIITNYPYVLLEGCASGGGRFDLGMLYYFPQIWTSDNTDAIARLNIQYGMSYVYPPSVMTAHVSDVPNNQVGRITPLKTRQLISMSALCGYELNIHKQSIEALEDICKYNKIYKQYSYLILEGTYYRLKSPQTSNEMAHCFVSQDKSTCMAMYFRVLSLPAYKISYLKFKGLKAEAKYKIERINKVYSGSELMNAGITLERIKEDFYSELFILKEER